MAEALPILRSVSCAAKWSGAPLLQMAQSVVLPGGADADGELRR